MKKVYALMRDGEIQFVFTSKKKAEKQMEYIKNAINSGKWFLDKNGNYESPEKFEFLGNYTICTKTTVSYCFLNKKTGKIISYNLFEKELNVSYGI